MKRIAFFNKDFLFTIIPQSTSTCKTISLFTLIFLKKIKKDSIIILILKSEMEVLHKYYLESSKTKFFHLIFILVNIQTTIY